MLRIVRNIFEIVILSALILSARCANYEQVFVGGNIYFTDADCYARMTRVRMCAQHPGLIVRHHDFENFPQGTTPHTTAPLDYLVAALSILLRPFRANYLDLAGAIVSPFFALIGGWFLWWWARGIKFRWTLLILYALSRILVHGAELGRPDHEALSILLVTIALCAEWKLQSETSRAWGVVSGAAWALAIWVSLYEPLFLFLIVIACRAAQDRQFFLAPHRRHGWFVFAAIILIALAIERRVPSISIFVSGEAFRNWSRTIGELARVSPFNPIWFHWAGYLIVIAPILFWLAFRQKNLLPAFMFALLITTFCLTIWRARWAYFFISILALALPSLFAAVESRAAVWIAFGLSILPILRDWDARIWPNELELARRVEQRNEAVQLRTLSVGLRAREVRPFMAPWWLSPSIAYWSGQPGVAGSSHETLPGIIESARFFLANDPEQVRKTLLTHDVFWIVAGDSDQIVPNSATLLDVALPSNPLAVVLEHTPSAAPAFIVPAMQTGAFRVFRVKL